MKIKKQHRKKKYLHKLNRKRMRNNLRSTGVVACKVLKEAWDHRKSSLRNLKEMGLANDPNKTIKIPSFKEQQLKRAKQMVHSSDSELEEEQPRIIPPKLNIAQKLEEEANLPRQRRFKNKRETCTTEHLTGVVAPMDFFLKSHLQTQFVNKLNRLFKKHKHIGLPWQPTSSHVDYSEFQHSNIDNDSTNVSGQQNNTSGAQHNQTPINFRQWETIGNRRNGSQANTLQFKVVSYNVLAQYLLESYPSLYRECDPQNLKWRTRANLLFEEIKQLNPDILCFQEVQVSHLSTFFSRFDQLGYHGVFKQKTGQRQDGCAIYYKQSMFTLQDQVSVEFNQQALPILNRDNIGIMVKLVPRCLAGSPFVVATTHLLYNPRRTDIRLAQLKVFLAEIDRFSYFSVNGQHGYLPIVLTGDLNSTPDSAVVELLDRDRVNVSLYRDSSDWRRVGITDYCQHLSVHLNRNMVLGAEYFQGIQHDMSLGRYNQLFNGRMVGHLLQLTSVYDRVKQNGHYEATTFQDYWVTVDYIYFSRHHLLTLVERLRLPTAEECQMMGPLPNNVYGSDHLSLGAVFEMKLRT